MLLETEKKCNADSEATRGEKVQKVLAFFCKKKET